MTPSAYRRQGNYVMMPGRALSAYPARLRDCGLLISANTPGLLGWTEAFDLILKGIGDRLSRIPMAKSALTLGFSPVVTRDTLARAGYAASFPHLLGSIYGFAPGDSDGSTGPSKAQSVPPTLGPTELVLTPAACYHVYPLFTDGQEAVDEAIDVSSFCFRNEPTGEPGRLVSFRMREFVRIGKRDEAYSWFEAWKTEALLFVQSLGLTARLEVATDPFFGPGRKLLASSQREQRLKFEVVAEIGRGHWTALASCNYHEDHFGRSFSIFSETGEYAYTSCVGFGLDRIGQALVDAHGPDLELWPDEVKGALG